MTTCSSGDAAAALQLLRDLRADHFVTFVVQVGSVRIEVGATHTPSSNIAPRAAQSVVGEYGGPAIERMLEGGEEGDEEVPAVRS